MGAPDNYIPVKKLFIASTFGSSYHEGAMEKGTVIPLVTDEMHANGYSTGAASPSMCRG